MLTGAKKKLLRMGELVKRTGVQKETIHFYINKGLLPRPLKTSKNMAYYGEEYVKRIRLIKELQLKRFLPLKVIKELLTQSSEALSDSEIELIRKSEPGLLQLQRRRDAYQPLSLDGLTRRTGLPPEEIEAMERCEMISSTRGEDGEKHYADADVKIAEAFAEMRRCGLTREAGFEVEEFRLQSDLISMMATEEVKVFTRKFAKRFPDDMPELLPKIAENAVESVGAFIWYLRKKKILEAVHRIAETGQHAESEEK